MMRGPGVSGRAVFARHATTTAADGRLGHRREGVRMTDKREEQWSATVDQLVALGMAMQLDAEALVHGLAINTAKLLSYVMVRSYCGPADIDAILRAYGEKLRGLTLEMIHHNDTGH
jgi:hypothetical protein